MKVTAQYASTHLEDLLSATDRGEDVEIAREDKPSVRLALVRPSSPKRSLLGAAEGMISTSADWDSPEVNGKIQQMFEASEIFPRTK